MRKLLFMLIFCVLSVAQLLAQTRVINGKVTDPAGNPIPNASVVIKGTSRGVSTANDGSFSITVPASAKALVISSVGSLNLEYPISNENFIQATLKANDKNLEEVVVTAFGIKKDKKTLGYGVTQIKAEELTQAHTTNVTNALAGKVPGVRINGSGGSFTGSSIIIRGFTTFTGSNQPLFVVDGVPFDNGGGGSPLQAGPSVSNRAIDLNQEDIETMTVLKGPSAAALYGSRASNGLILITTKKGKFNQKNNVQVFSSYGVETVNRFPDYQNTYAQGTGGVFNVASAGSWGPEMKGQTVTNFYGTQEPLVAYPNNVTDLFRNGENFQNNVSFSGGSDKNAFRFSYGNTVNTGVLNNNRLVRNNFSVNTNSRVTEKLTVSVSANYVNNASKRTQQGNQLSNPLFRGWFTPRSYDLTRLPYYDAAGNQSYYGGEDNPRWTIENNRYRDEINRFYGYASLNMKFTSWLQGDYKIGTDVYSTFRHAYDQIGARGGANTNAGGVGGVLEVRNQYRSYNSNGFLTANKKFGDFNLTGIVGNEISQIYSSFDQTIGKGVVVKDFEQLKNTTAFTPSNGSTTVRLVGLYGDFTAGYKSIASLNVTLRNDWSSTFKANNRSYLYNAIAASVNITELFPSIKGDIIDNIKIRGNIATVGKAGTDFAYATDSYYGAAASADGFGPSIVFPFNGLAGFTLNDAAGNAALGPEFTTNKEIAAELSFFKNRIGIEATVYNQKSRDLIFAVPVSNASGIGSTVKNAGKLTNKGVELGVNLVPIRSNTFTWSIFTSYTQFKSTVDELNDGVTNIFLGGFTTPNIRLVSGEEYGQIYGNAYQRDTKTGQMLIGANGLPLATPGVQRIGNPNPKWLMGITNNFSFKGLTLSFLMDIRKGGDIYSRNVADLRRQGVAIETAEFARYNPDGTTATPYMFEGISTVTGLPNAVKVSAQNYWGNSGKYVAAEGFILDGSWFRVREASLSYKLPANSLRHLPFGNVEFSVYGRNLYLKAKNYPHLDPEQNALGISNAQGLEFNALPQTRSMGVSLKFTL